MQPKKARDENFLNQLRELKPDLIITCAYGQILTQDFLNIPKFGTLNIHPSRLPYLRGATPVQSTLLNGDKVAAVSILFTVLALDAGDIIVQEDFPILPEECAGDLLDRLFFASGPLLERALDLVTDPDFKAQAQDESKVVHCKKITKYDAQINWEHSYLEIINRYRAYKPWPGLYTYWQNSRVLLDEVFYDKNIVDLAQDLFPIDKKPGQFYFCKKIEALIFVVADGFLGVRKLKLEGKNF